MFDVNKLREDFPILKRKIGGMPLIFLDSTSTSQKPIQVLDVIRNYYENFNSNPNRALYKICEEATIAYEDAHGKVSGFINANGNEEIIFVRNTNEAINLVLYSWALHNLKKGDEIISTVMEHHANIVPWQLLQKDGIKLKFVDISEDGTLKLEQYDELITKKTKLVTVTQVSNVLGTINPVKEIGKIAHDNGALFLVDGAQSVPHMPVDVKDLNCDFLAFSGHKMLAPMNIGVLYGKKEILESMEPFMRGSDMIKEVSLTETTWNDLPWKFEAGTPNVEGAVGLSAAIDYLNKIGMENVREHEKEITSYALKQLLDINMLKIYGPTDADIRGGVISFNLADVHSHDLATILDDFGIAIRSGHHCAQPLMKRLGISSAARASFYVYNTKKEVDALADALVKSKVIFKVGA